MKALVEIEIDESVLPVANDLPNAVAYLQRHIHNSLINYREDHEVRVNVLNVINFKEGFK